MLPPGWHVGWRSPPLQPSLSFHHGKHEKLLSYLSWYPKQTWSPCLTDSPSHFTLSSSLYTFSFRSPPQTIILFLSSAHRHLSVLENISPLLLYLNLAVPIFCATYRYKWDDSSKCDMLKMKSPIQGNWTHTLEGRRWLCGERLAWGLLSVTLCWGRGCSRHSASGVSGLGGMKPWPSRREWFSWNKPLELMNFTVLCPSYMP